MLINYISDDFLHHLHIIKTVNNISISNINIILYHRCFISSHDANFHQISKIINKENTACAEPLAKAEADVALIQAKVILSIRIKKTKRHYHRLVGYKKISCLLAILTVLAFKSQQLRLAG